MGAIFSLLYPRYNIEANPNSREQPVDPFWLASRQDSGRPGEPKNLGPSKCVGQPSMCSRQVNFVDSLSNILLELLEIVHTKTNLHFASFRSSLDSNSNKRQANRAERNFVGSHSDPGEYKARVIHLSWASQCCGRSSREGNDDNFDKRIRLAARRAKTTTTTTR